MDPNTRTGRQRLLALGIAAVIMATVGVILIIVNRADSPSASGIVGAYALTGEMPEGRRMRLEIRSDKHWVMANMLTGYWGTWKESGSAYDLICTDGPAGKLPSPQTQQAFLEAGGAKLHLGEKSSEMDFVRTSGGFTLPASP